MMDSTTNQLPPSPTQATDDKNVYFGAQPIVKLLPELKKRFDDYRNFLQRTGILARVRKSFNYYYGFSDKGRFTSSEIGEGGKGGGLRLMKVNHFRNNVQHVLTMTTSQRPALKTRAANTDYASQIQTILGDGLLEYYLREKRIERDLKQAAETALVQLEGFIVVDWDTEAGNAYGFEPETNELGEAVVKSDGSPAGKVIREGDVKCRVYSFLEVARDVDRRDQNHDWVIVESSANKFDLAAQWPELADQILSLTPDKDRAKWQLWGQSNEGGAHDMIPVFQFRHRQSPSMPEGRLVVYLNDQIKLSDTPFPYEDLPGGLGVYRITPSEFLGTSFGYSSALDVLSVQEALDALYSVVITNQTTFGVQNVMAPKGHNIEYTQLAEGLNLIEYEKALGAPEALELCKTPPEIFKFIPTLVSDQRIMMGLNDVVVGDPQASLKSGSALALVASQAIQFNYEFQKSWAELLEDVGLAILKLLQQNANTKRVAAIVGKHNMPYIKEFMGDDLKHINRVLVDIDNPMSRTAAGRLEMANNLLNAQAVDSRQYLMVAQTGKLEALIENKESHLLLMRQENESLREGKPVPVLATDLHNEHIAEHSSLLDSPDARNNPELAQMATEHIQAHIEALRTVDPALLQMRGQTPLAPPMMDAGAMGAPPGTQAPSADKQTPPGQEPAPPGAIKNGPTPAQPSMPTNPMSGNQFNNENGGQ